MKSLRTNQFGASHIFALLAIVVLLGIGFIGYRVTTMSKTPANDSNTTSSVSQSQTLRSKGDVVKADKDLDSVPVDTDLDPSQLDNDLSELQ